MKHQLDSGSRQGLGEAIVLLGAFVVDLWVLKGFNSPLVELPAFCVVVIVFLRSIKRRGGLERILPSGAESATRAWLEMFAITSLPAIALVAWGMAIRGSYDEIPLKIAQPNALVLALWVGQHLQMPVVGSST